jgi:hypothetical protein
MIIFQSNETNSDFAKEPSGDGHNRPPKATAKFQHKTIFLWHLHLCFCEVEPQIGALINSVSATPLWFRDLGHWPGFASNWLSFHRFIVQVFSQKKIRWSLVQVSFVFGVGTASNIHPACGISESCCHSRGQRPVDLLQFNGQKALVSAVCCVFWVFQLGRVLDGG